jgi:hypothetical protein
LETKLPTPNEILLKHLPPTQVETPVSPSTEAPSNAPAKVDPPTPATPEVSTTEVNIDDWDTPPAPSTPEPTTVVNDTPKAPETSTTQPVDEWVGVDEKLKKAVEYAKKGGDYLTYLGINKVDYYKIDPVDIYKQSILSNQSFSPEEKKELLESMSPLQMKMEGIRLQAQYTQLQNQQVAEFEGSLQQAERAKAERKLRADTELKATLDKVDKIAGLSLKPHVKQDIYDAITTGRMQRELFYDQKTGDYDYQSMIETYFIKRNLQKILDHTKKVTSSDTLRQHFKETTNASIDKSKEAPAPITPTPSDPINDFIAKSRAGGKK